MTYSKSSTSLRFAASTKNTLKQEPISSENGVGDWTKLILLLHRAMVIYCWLCPLLFKWKYNLSTSLGNMKTPSRQNLGCSLTPKMWTFPPLRSRKFNNSHHYKVCNTIRWILTNLVRFTSWLFIFRIKICRKWLCLTFK